MQWLAKEDWCQRITVLDIPTLTEDDIVIMEETLRVIGPRLKELAVGFAMDVIMKWDGERRLLSLKHCTNLHVFTIRCLKFRIRPLDAAFYIPSAYVTTVLSTLTSPFLNTLNLRLKSAHLRIREDEHIVHWVNLCETVLALPTLRTNGRTQSLTPASASERTTPLLLLRLAFNMRTSLKDDASPCIQRGLAGLQEDGRILVQYYFYDPWKNTTSTCLTV